MGSRLVVDGIDVYVVCMDVWLRDWINDLIIFFLLDVG